MHCLIAADSFARGQAEFRLGKKRYFFQTMPGGSAEFIATGCGDWYHLGGGIGHIH